PPGLGARAAFFVGRRRSLDAPRRVGIPAHALDAGWRTTWVDPGDVALVGRFRGQRPTVRHAYGPSGSIEAGEVVGPDDGAHEVDVVGALFGVAHEAGGEEFAGGRAAGGALFGAEAAQAAVARVGVEIVDVGADGGADVGVGGDLEGGAGFTPGGHHAAAGGVAAQAEKRVALAGEARGAPAGLDGGLGDHERGRDGVHAGEQAGEQRAVDGLDGGDA